MVRRGIVVAPDILVGGTPCQAFSIAGLRDGLLDERGQLTLSFVDLANAMDEVRDNEEKEPTIIVWENVPGVLTSKDNAFGCFLAGLVGEDDPLVPAGERWGNAGVVYGPKRAAAWRVLDSQYFGVAQRRRRVFVIASAREGFDPAAVLFEFHGVRRDFAPSRETREGFAADAGKSASPRSSPRNGEGGHLSREGDGRDSSFGSHWDGGEVHPTLNQSAKGSGGIGASNQEIFSQRGGGLVAGYRATDWMKGPIGARMLAFGEYAIDETASTMKARDYKDATDLVLCVHGTQDPGTQRDLAHTLGRNSGQENAVAIPMAICENQRGEVRLSPKTNALTAGGGKPGQGYAAVAIPIHDQATRFAGKRGKNQDGKGNGLGIGRPGDPMLTLTAGDRHAVAIPLDLRNAGRDPEKHDKQNRQGVGVGEPGDPAHTCTAACVHGVAHAPISWDEELNANTDLAGTLVRGGQGGRHDGVAYCAEVAPTMGASGPPYSRTGNSRVEAEAVVATFKPGQSADSRSIGHEEDIAPTLEGGGGGNNKPAMVDYGAMVVRRLMPHECEWLQGFPARWTLVPQKKANRKYLSQPRQGYQYVEIDGECWQLMADGPRYKMCGNSMTTLVMRWLGHRIKSHLDTNADLARLIG